MAGRTILVVGLVLMAGSAFAQTPPLTPPKPAPAPAKPVVAFPSEAKIGYINFQEIFSESNVGKQGLTQIKALNDRLAAGLAARDKEIQGLTDKIRTQEGVVSAETFAAWNRELARKQREAQFAQQEAQVEVTQTQEELLASFQRQVDPIVETIRAEKGLWMIFAVGNEAGGLSVAAAHSGVNLSAEVTKRLNAGK